MQCRNDWQVELKLVIVIISRVIVGKERDTTREKQLVSYTSLLLWCP